MQKIVFLTRDLSGRGGILRVISTLANELIEQYKVEIISIGKLKNSSIQYKFDQRIDITFLNVLQKNNTRLGHYKFVFKSFIKLFFHFLKKKPDVVYSIFPFSLYIWIFKIFRIKIIMAEHGAHKIYKKRFLNYLKLIVKFVDCFVVLTREDYIFYSENLKLKNTKYIPNPLPFNSVEKSRLCKKNILTVGRLEEEKQQNDFIESVTKVIEKNTDWTASIRGEGTLKKNLESLIKQKNMKDKIKILGSTSNIERDYIESSIFILTSRYEGLSMVILEAMHCGLPVIAYDCPVGPRELILDGVNGYLIDVGNKKELEKKINYLITNPKVMKEMGKQSILLSKKYEIKNIIKRWKEII